MIARLGMGAGLASACPFNLQYLNFTIMSKKNKQSNSDLNTYPHPQSERDTYPGYKFISYAEMQHKMTEKGQQASAIIRRILKQT